MCIDPPKSPFLRGTLRAFCPPFQGGLGGSKACGATLEDLYVHSSTQRGRACSRCPCPPCPFSSFLTNHSLNVIYKYFYICDKYRNVLYKMRNVNKERQAVGHKRRDVFYE